MDDKINSFGDLNGVKGFKLVHTNVRSLPKKIDQLRVLLLDSRIDVVTISETWLNASVTLPEVEIGGFLAYRQDRESGTRVKKKGGGLLTYINSKHASDSEELLDLNKVTRDMELQWSIIHREHSKDVVICNVYRPPCGKLDNFISYMEECIKTFDLGKVELFVLGDMNVDFKSKKSSEYKKLNFLIQSNGLTQYIRNTTRNTMNSNSLVDLVLTNSKYISSAGLIDHHFSDHQPVYVVKKKKRDDRPKVEFKGRSYKNFDRRIFREELLKVDWDSFYKIQDPNIAWDFMLDRFLPILDTMCPVQTFSIKNYKPDWITPELVEQIKDRDYFYSKAKRNGDDDSWNIARHLRNTTNYNVRKAKRDFILDELEHCNNDCKKFWKTIKTVVPSNKGDTRRDILLKRDGMKVDRPEIAHFINDYFINIGNMNKQRDPNLSSNLPSQSQSHDNVSTEPPDPCGTLLEDWFPDEFTVEEVLKVVKNINVSKSSGLQDISSFVVKEVFTILICQVTHMMNISVKSSTFPTAWKKALVIPIPKGGNLSLVQNYRPISLLPLPGKVLEKLMHKQLIEYIDDHSLLTDNQHGFRKGHSCIHSAAQLTNFIDKKMDSRTPTLAVFVDFRKAFDCVQHPILIEKLSCLGLNSKVVEWFRSYLSNRKQQVLANNVRSTFQTITQGVPQGSVLGPLFYILYANDIVRVIKNCKMALYADDTVLYTANLKFETSVQKARDDVLALSGWCKANGIGMNTDKTKVMIFGNAKKVAGLPKVHINVNDVSLQTFFNYKYLGITLDGQLNYARHVSKLISNVSLKLKQFRRMRSFLNTKAATLVYKNMILPIIEYGDIFLTGATNGNKKKLQILQNKGLRCALNADKDISTRELHTEAKLMRLKHRR